MLGSRKTWCSRALVAALAFTGSSDAQAQITFVHATDPHLFDGPAPKREPTDDSSCVEGNSSASGNGRLQNGERKAPFNEVNFTALWHLVQHVNGMSPAPEFVAITGDIGVEQLLEPVKLTNDSHQCPAVTRPAPGLTLTRKKSLEEGAEKVAEFVGRSRVRRWLFVPGNNDLWNEKPDLRYFDYFLGQLRSLLGSSFQVHDLTKSPVVLPEDERYVFAGLDSSSFKNNDSHACMLANAERQRESVAGVAARLHGLESNQWMYVFYHIPEVNDPYLRSDAGLGVKFVSRASPIRFPYSAWLVADGVRDLWQREIVDDPRVKGLFAGHFHSNRRSCYQELSWAEGYPQTVIDKLKVAPPIAEKLQQDKDAMARGFQIVNLGDGGEVTTNICWYQPNGSFTGEGCNQQQPAASATIWPWLALVGIIVAVAVIGWIEHRRTGWSTATSVRVLLL